jgi:hypothetical protein
VFLCVRDHFPVLQSLQWPVLNFVPGRDRDYLNLNVTYAANVVKFGMIISLFPKPLKLVVSRMLSNLPSQIQQEIEFIKPMVEERFAKMQEYGEDWDDKPVCLTMYLVSLWSHG